MAHQLSADHCVGHERRDMTMLNGRCHVDCLTTVRLGHGAACTDDRSFSTMTLIREVSRGGGKSVHASQQIFSAGMALRGVAEPPPSGENSSRESHRPPIPRVSRTCGGERPLATRMPPFAILRRQPTVQDAFRWCFCLPWPQKFSRLCFVNYCHGRRQFSSRTGG